MSHSEEPFIDQKSHTFWLKLIAVFWLVSGGMGIYYFEMHLKPVGVFLLLFSTGIFLHWRISKLALGTYWSIMCLIALVVLIRDGYEWSRLLRVLKGGFFVYMLAVWDPSFRVKTKEG